uniref:Uncharacterized protein K02A2.6-like n=1 Tax=Saccoglossus kowalevskii TaxID=10224 RepID=A0ABM0GIF4_SACKO|nr:PREDICTED: uncharacterized protein K02A2.6-like [Saccoglossus kowalevskii]
MATALPVFPAFSVYGDSTSIGPRWEKWLKKFETFLVAYDIKNNARKRALLLFSAGDEVADVFETLPDVDGSDNVYKAAVDALNKYFLPKVNKTYEVNVFRHATQKTDESLDQLRRKALRDDLTLEALLDSGRSFEVSERQARGIENQFETETEVNTVQPVKKSQWKRNKYKKSQQYTGKPKRVEPDRKHKSCFRCGGKYPHSGECPARDQKCRKCDKTGHFAKVCRSKILQHVNSATTKDFSSSDDDYAYHITVSSISTNQQPDTKIDIDGQTVKCIIDSGAGTNVLDEKTCKLLNNAEITQCSKNVYAYGSKKPLPILGEVKVNVKSPITQQSTFTKFHVVKGSAGNLLGYYTATQLGLLHIVNSLSTCTSDSLIEKYADRFEGIGKMRDTKAILHINTSVKPVAQQHRRVPFHVREQVEAEINKLEQLDIIEKADGATPWVSPIVIVPKKTGIRVCVNMRAANQAIERERHPMPTIEDLIVDLNGATVFSKIDLNQGYHQLELDTKSRHITTFATHMGLYRYKRLSFGINSAAEIFQKAVSDMIQGIRGAKNLSDDIIIYGKTQQEHDEMLRAVFQRLRKYNITANQQKCEFSKSLIQFYGHTFSSAGIMADDKKVTAIINVRAPEDATAVRSFLGMAQYIARFVPDFATIATPLRILTHKDTKWEWGPEQQGSFEKLKSLLASHKVMKYFDPRLKTELLVDASPTGLGAVLTQVNETRDTCNIIAYASHALTDTESRYSQTEREALAVIWACEHFHIYVFGSEFKVITDHKPLEGMFNKSNSKLTARLERLSLRLQPYQVVLEYQPGESNPADYMSRHPDQVNHCKDHVSRIDTYINFIIENAIPPAMTMAEIKQATSEDEILQKIMEVINTQKWYDLHHDVVQYKAVKDELSTANGVVLRGNRIVVPKKLQQKAICLAHVGHQGVVKTKKLLRETLWFPGIDKMVEETVTRCIPCQASTHGPKPSIEPLKMSTLPNGPWQEVSADFCGPFPNGKYLLVVIDDYSRYPEVEICNSTSAEAAIPHFDAIFARQGIPDIVKTDNGPPYNGDEFKRFFKYVGFRHRKITSLWPKANGEAERMMQALEKAVRAAKLEGKSWCQGLFQFLRQYRATPHSTTGISPFKALNSRKMKTTLPQIYNNKPDRKIQASDAKRKLCMKKYADTRNHAKASDLGIGDRVLVKQQKRNKMSTPFNPEPYEVVSKKGSMTTVQRGNHEITRNASFFKRIPHENNVETNQTISDNLQILDNPQT